MNAGIHGNEPAGVRASLVVRDELAAAGVRLRGRVVFVAANRPALVCGRRFLVRDLNRGWTRRGITALMAQAPHSDTPEDAVQRQLLSFYMRELRRAAGPVAFLDLHTSSAEGAPFSCLADTMVNRRWALQLPVPVILGLEEAIDGAVMEWFEDRGVAALAVEGGRHEDPAAVDNLADVIRLSLVARGVLDPGAARAAGIDCVGSRMRLRDASAGLPRVVEVIHRHERARSDGFAMRPGFSSFMKVRRREPLADDRGGVVSAPTAGRVLLPLYQGQGDDGFFLARDVAWPWLWLAAGARWLGLQHVVSWLPGVRVDPQDGRAVLVDTKAAWWLVVEVFHLLGYRKRRWCEEGAVWAFRRRGTREGEGGLAALGARMVAFGRAVVKRARG